MRGLTPEKFDKQLLVRPRSISSNFDADFSQKSRPITLVAGQRYYIEVLHKDNYGGDFCQIGWTKPGADREIIPGLALETFIPVPDDQDDDELPDDWEITNGLSSTDNGSANPANGTIGDLDGDGLTNSAEFKAGTRADLADTDGDGVNDREEVELTETQALMADAAPFQPVVTIDGSAFTADHGSWFAEGVAGYQGTTRGWAEYDFSLTAAGVYQVEARISPKILGPSTAPVEVVISVDGQELDRIPITVRADNIETVKVLSPWLQAGSHKVRVFIDNAVTARRMGIESLVIAAARGTDANSNDTPDWVEARISKHNSFEAPTESLTSPVCLEGKAKWPVLTTIAAQAVQLAPNDRWFADVALDPVVPLDINASLENGAISVTRQVTWLPTNLLTTSSLSIRLGDSLKLSAFTGITGTPEESVTLTVEGQTTTFTADQPLVHAFTTAGSIPVLVTHSLGGNLTTAATTINVVAAPVIESPVCVVDFYREVNIPALSPGVSLQLDSRIEIGDIAYSAGGQRLTLRLNSLENRSSVFRLGENTGPIVSSLPFRAMRVRSGSQTSLLITKSSPTGWTQAIMPIMIDGSWPDTVVKMEIFIGGVTFDDGSLTRSINPAAECDAFGVNRLVFYRTGSVGSVCHRISIWQGSNRIAWKQ